MKARAVYNRFQESLVLGFFVLGCLGYHTSAQVMLVVLWLSFFIEVK